MPNTSIWKLATLIVILLSLSAAQTAQAKGWRVAHRVTAYCLWGTMADGTQVRPGSAANNRHPLGTRIRLSRPVFGRTLYTIRDRIGHGTELDFWTGSCSTAINFGNNGGRPVYYKLGWARRR